MGRAAKQSRAPVVRDAVSMAEKLEGRKMMKTPHTHQSIGAFKEQLTLIPTLEFSPIWPSPTTIEGRVLAELLRGEWLDHRDLIDGGSSWRLAAYINSLIKKGWPIVAFDRSAPFAGCPSRCISVYALPPEIIEKVQSVRGAA